MQFQAFVEDEVFSPTLVAEALRTTKSEIAGTLGLGKGRVYACFADPRAQDAGSPAPDAGDSQPRRGGDGLVARRLCLVPRRAPARVRRCDPGSVAARRPEPRTCMPISTGSWPAATPEPPLARCGSRDWSIGRTTRSGPGRLCPEKARGVTAGASTAAGSRRSTPRSRRSPPFAKRSRSAGQCSLSPSAPTRSISNPSSMRRRKNRAGRSG